MRLSATWATPIVLAASSREQSVYTVSSSPRCPLISRMGLTRTKIRGHRENRIHAGRSTLPSLVQQQYMPVAMRLPFVVNATCSGKLTLIKVSPRARPM